MVYHGLLKTIISCFTGLITEEEEEVLGTEKVSLVPKDYIHLCFLERGSAKKKKKKSVHCCHSRQMGQYFQTLSDFFPRSLQSSLQLLLGTHIYFCSSCRRQNLACGVSYRTVKIPIYSRWVGLVGTSEELLEGLQPKPSCSLLMGKTRMEMGVAHGNAKAQCFTQKVSPCISAEF